MSSRRFPLVLVLAALAASVVWSACGGDDDPTCQASAELCNGLDDDCDGQVDDGFDVGAACAEGVGACAAAGVKVCAAGGAATECTAVAGEPSAESCNQVDDDCDGQTDQGLAGCCVPSTTRACGADVGACRAGLETCGATGAWGACLLAGAPVILPGTQAETCDGLDEDCDGQTDEPDAAGCSTFHQDQDADTYGAGVGACLCAASPPFTVADATDCDDADAGVHPGAVEACSGLDEDCDGQTDEGFDLGAACSAGVGACAASGLRVCSAGGAASECNAVPGDPSPESCDGGDDDCDGSTDEELTAPPCAMQTGVCAGSRAACGGTSGWLACGAGEYGASYQAVESSCDGLDNDCDGTTDEAAVPPVPVCQISNEFGSCTGAWSCGGAAGWSCQGRTPAAELCNALDDECDGLTDEGYPVGASCTAGVGVCQRTGSFACKADATGVECSAVPAWGDASNELCDGLDNDCDGSTDEELPVIPLCEKQNGVCAGAKKLPVLCVSGAWQACTNEAYLAHSAAYEASELACDGLDNDCDGTTDETPCP